MEGNLGKSYMPSRRLSVKRRERVPLFKQQESLQDGKQGLRTAAVDVTKSPFLAKFYSSANLLLSHIVFDDSVEFPCSSVLLPQSFSFPLQTLQPQVYA